MASSLIDLNKAAIDGNLEQLREAFEKGCKWDKKTINNVALSGNFDCIKYLIDHKELSKEETGEDEGDEEGGEDEEGEDEGKGKGEGKGKERKFNYGNDWDGDSENLDYNEQEYIEDFFCGAYISLNESVTYYLAKYGNLRGLKYATENGYPLTSHTTTIAAYYGHLDCLKYAHENGGEIDDYACAFATINGHLDCLKYVHENGGDFECFTCSIARHRGHLECLKYALENGGEEI